MASKRAADAAELDAGVEPKHASSISDAEVEESVVFLVLIDDMHGISMCAAFKSCARKLGLMAEWDYIVACNSIITKENPIGRKHAARLMCAHPDLDGQKLLADMEADVEESGPSCEYWYPDDYGTLVGHTTRVVAEVTVHCF